MWAETEEPFFPVYASLPLSPRFARHFPPHSGEANTKEERIHIFYMNKNKNMGMTYTKKPSPLVGEGVSRADERGKKHKNSFLQNDSKYLPVILERSNGKRTAFRGAERRCKSV